MKMANKKRDNENLRQSLQLFSDYVDFCRPLMARLFIAGKFISTVYQQNMQFIFNETNVTLTLRLTIKRYMNR